MMRYRKWARPLTVDTFEKADGKLTGEPGANTGERFCRPG
jgi:hypothetical protein